jgi:trimeric autotransporter adhesin
MVFIPNASPLLNRGDEDAGIYCKHHQNHYQTRANSQAGVIAMKTILHQVAVVFLLSILCSPMFGQVAARRAPAVDTISEPLVTAQLGGDYIRFSAMTVGTRIRLEILSQAGDTLFDSSLQPGNLIDWPVANRQGSPLPDGIYGCIVTVEELSGRITYNRGVFRIFEGKASLDTYAAPLAEAASADTGAGNISILSADDRFPFAFVGHDATDARFESTAGGLIFHAGQFHPTEAEPSPHMRLTPKGDLGIGIREPAAKLDVAGLIRTSEGIQFPDGSIQKTAANPIILDALTPLGQRNPGLGGNASSLLRSLSPARNNDASRILAQGGDPARVNGAETLWNTYYGSQAGASLNEAGGAAFNAFFGYASGVASTTGSQNSMFGDNSGAGNTIGSYNTYVGSVAGWKGVTANNNTFVGYGAGKNNTASGNAFVGYKAGETNTSGGANAFFGTQAGAANTTGCCNAFAGYQAGIVNSTGSSNAFFGDQAGESHVNGNYNTLVGAGSGAFLVAGINNTMMGFQSGLSTTSSDNAFVGYRAGAANTSGNENAFFGSEAGSNNSTGIQNVILGRSAGHTNSTGAYNVMLGFESGFTNLDGWANAFMGYWAGRANTSGHWNAFGGTRAGYHNISGSQNAFFGQEAGQGNTSGNYNSSLGSWAIGNSTTGHYNTAAGYNAGVTNTAESNNTFLGAISDGAAGITNATAIGYRAKVSQSDSLVLGSINGINGAAADTRVGIGISSPERRFHVAETSTATARGVSFDQYSSDQFASVFILRKSRGAVSGAHGILLNGDALFNFTGQGSDGTKFVDAARIRMEIDGTPGVSDMPGRMTFWTTADGTASTTERMRIDSVGNVGIGTTAPSERLHVAGNIRATGSIFSQPSPETEIPDYVFEPDYKLMSVDELQQYLEREKHLPKMPNAAEIKEKGLNISDFQMKLLEKIEELTLYTVQQAKELKDKDAAINSLSVQLQARDGAISTLNARLALKDEQVSSHDARLEALEQMLRQMPRQGEKK